MSLVAATAFASAAPAQLLFPRDGATVIGNTPTLVWRADPADRTEVCVDGVLLATLPGDLHEYVAFPLSFGTHRWTVTTVRGTERITSAEAGFTVDDRPVTSLPPRATLLRTGWAVQSSQVVGLDGARLSSGEPDLHGWSRTSVPATVLTALVRNGVYPDPNIGLNNTRIPDANDAFNAEYHLLQYSHIPGRNPWAKPYWYVTSFATPAGYAGKRVWLNFGEINYRAEVWLNGHRVAGPDEMVGMERAFRFDVTSLLHGEGANHLAVAIYPLDHPGEPAPPPVTPLADPGRNMGADAVISRDYTKWDVIGWDWQPAVRDRDMGITEDVFLSATDDLEVRDVYVTSALPMPDTSVADVTVAFDLVNHGGSKLVGEVSATLDDGAGGAITVTHAFEVTAQTTRRVAWSPLSDPELRIRHPRLWWPADMGQPNLYTLRIEARSGAAETRSETTFGIRDLQTYIDAASGTRAFRINGHPLYGAGGNWVIDMMLNWTASRYDNEIEMTRRSRLNFLRVWGPTGVPPAAFFAAADRAGILIWQDFLHDHWGTDNNKPGNAPDEKLFAAATTDIIKRLRNHPSLFLWCGGNEGPNPREELITHKLLPTFDPRGGRYYLRASNADGIQGGGPYDTLQPEAYFGHFKIRGFNSEIGPSGVPVWESLRQFLDPVPEQFAPGRFPLDGAWAYHDATDRDDDRKFSHYDTVLRTRYGVRGGTDLAAARDYARMAQVLNYDAYRAALEALNQHRWTDSSGFALWKSNSSWPSVIWQIYDWYQQLHAGFFAVRRALEPLHVQFDAGDRTLAVVNRLDVAQRGLRVEAALSTPDLRPLWREARACDLDPQRTQVLDVKVPPQSAATFLRLRLFSADDTLVSENSYALPATSASGGASDAVAALAAFRSLPAAKLAVHPDGRSADGRSFRVQLTNTGTALAWRVRLQLVLADTDAEIRPNYWNDNYVTLLPGESRELTVDLPPHTAVDAADVLVSGPNTPEQRVRLGRAAATP